MKIAKLMFAAAVLMAPLASASEPDKAPPVNPLWHEQKIKNYLLHMSWPEVEALLKRTDMVIIPVASLEQHGMHGPIGTDYLNGLEKALLIAQQTDVLVAPILLPGISPYHMEFPGTITLSEETTQKVYVEAVQSLLHHGFKRFLFLNAHTGNTAMIHFVVDRINQETPGIAVELTEAAGTMRSRSQNGAREPQGPYIFDQHGGVGETSSSLYLTPGLVNLQAGKVATLTYPPTLQAMLPKVLDHDAAATLVFNAEALKGKVTGKHSSTRELTDAGQWSVLDPKTATAEKGKAATDGFVASSVAFINKWKELRPSGAK